MSTSPPTARRGQPFIVEVLRTRPWARKAVSIASLVLLVVGVAMLSYPLATNYYQHRRQGELSKQLASPELRQAYLDGKVGIGDSLTRIKIPAIDLDVVVVQGTSAAALRAGAGHYVQTPLPCQDSNVAIAGHRTTYGKPFANVDRLHAGDTIQLDTPIGGCVYQVQKVFVVDKADLSVIQPTPDKSLTLTSCHPKGSAAQRIVVRAKWQKDLQAT